MRDHRDHGGVVSPERRPEPAGLCCFHPSRGDRTRSETDVSDGVAVCGRHIRRTVPATKQKEQFATVVIDRTVVVGVLIGLAYIGLVLKERESQAEEAA